MYQWASAIIGSRAVHLSGDRFLVPFADMFNYQAVAVSRVATVPRLECTVTLSTACGMGCA